MSRSYESLAFSETAPNLRHRIGSSNNALATFQLNETRNFAKSAPSLQELTSISSPNKKAEVVQTNMKDFDNRVKDSMKELDSKLISLRHLFKPGDPLHERNIAATKLAAIIRG